MKQKIEAIKTMIPSKSELINVGRAGRHFPASVLKWVRSEFIWGLLIVPVLYIALIYSLCDANFLGWSDSDVFKPLMEIVHPLLLAGFLLVSLQSWRLTRDAAFWFLTVLSVFVLARELIGQGSTFVLYTAIIGLILYGSHNPQRIGWLILWDTSWKLPYSSNLEESLESLGGLFLLCTPFAVSVSRTAGLSKPDTNPQK